MGTFNQEVMYWPGHPCEKGHQSPFYKKGYHCVECRRILCRSWRERNKDRERDTSKAWRDANAERLRARARGRYHSGSSKKITDRAWKRRNKAKLAALQRARDAAKLQRTPAWADKAAIRWFYELASYMTAATGIQHQVDHLVPLQGRNVCGLHVQNNLRVVTAEENARKKNKWDGGKDFPADFWVKTHWEHLLDPVSQA
jgi:hypothetical protein